MPFNLIFFSFFLKPPFLSILAPIVNHIRRKEVKSKEKVKGFSEVFLAFIESVTSLWAMSPYVRMSSVGLPSVCYNFHKGREVTFLCYYRSTFLSSHRYRWNSGSRRTPTWAGCRRWWRGRGSGHRWAEPPGPRPQSSTWTSRWLR